MLHDPELVAETRAWFVRAHRDLAGDRVGLTAEPPLTGDAVSRGAGWERLALALSLLCCVISYKLQWSRVIDDAEGATIKRPTMNHQMASMEPRHR